jgi:uncharacterized protein
MLAFCQCGNDNLSQLQSCCSTTIAHSQNKNAHAAMANEFWNKAQENLTAAELLLGASLYNAAVNRAYYAAFQAALAVIVEKGLQPNTDHAKVQSTFNGEVVRRSKYITNSYKHYLLAMQDSRNIADYKLTHVGKSKAEKQVRMANEFLKIIEMEIPQ